jgi:hypothetical protein
MCGGLPFADLSRLNASSWTRSALDFVIAWVRLFCLSEPVDVLIWLDEQTPADFS